MVRYSEDFKEAFVDGYSFRRDGKTGYYLSGRKINGKRKRLHVYVWEAVNGEVPKGFAVHHIDMDKRNNEIGNLCLMSTSQHMVEHGRRLSEEQRKAKAINVMKNGMPAAKAWHSSDEGLEWHRKHGTEVFRNREPKTHTCEFCGSSFETIRYYKEGDRKFCSNKCKSAYRRRSGVDDVVKICEACGGEYVANKYQKTKLCKDCQNRRGYPRGRVQHGS